MTNYEAAADEHAAMEMQSQADGEYAGEIMQLEELQALEAEGRHLQELLAQEQEELEMLLLASEQEQLRALQAQEAIDLREATALSLSEAASSEWAPSSPLLGPMQWFDGEKWHDSAVSPEPALEEEQKAPEPAAKECSNELRVATALEASKSSTIAAAEEGVLKQPQRAEDAVAPKNARAQVEICVFDATIPTRYISS